MKSPRKLKCRSGFVSSGFCWMVLATILSVPANAQENPYQLITPWGELPGGRQMGVVTGVQPDPDGEHIWIVERCGSNQCAGSSLHPIHKLDRDGNTVMSIGAGLAPRLRHGRRRQPLDYRGGAGGGRAGRAGFGKRHGPPGFETESGRRGAHAPG